MEVALLAVTALVLVLVMQCSARSQAPEKPPAAILEAQGQSVDLASLRALLSSGQVDEVVEALSRADRAIGQKVYRVAAALERRAEDAEESARRASPDRPTWKDGLLVLLLGGGLLAVLYHGRVVGRELRRDLDDRARYEEAIHRRLLSVEIEQAKATGALPALRDRLENMERVVAGPVVQRMLRASLVEGEDDENLLEDLRTAVRDLRDLTGRPESS
jgi:hypothetical protein